MKIMRATQSLFLIGVLILTQLSFGWAKTGESKVRPPSNRQLGTKFDFSDMTVKGRYQYPDEAITRVEDDKKLNDLLGMRKDFKDRIQISESQRKD